MDIGARVTGIDSGSIVEALTGHFSNMQVVSIKTEQSPKRDQILVFDNELSDDKKEIMRLKKLLQEKDSQAREMEANTKMAVESIQTFHQQQQALYDEFLILRQKYDDQKAQLITTLWTHCGAYHPELRMIPSQEGKDFVETTSVIGRYAISDVLGEGQFATVFSCSTHSIPGDLAIKVIKKERITSFSSLRRVSNEISILKKLDSSHIVKIMDVMQSASKLYIVTEKGGQDLFEFFDEHPEGVQESWALEIVGAIMEAVLYCHLHHVCHRDLKPENILVKFDSESGKCIDLKLCDFGLSTQYDENVMLSDFCGSPGFFAPEMILTGNYYGSRIDIWSVGCILLELVLGHERFCDTWMGSYDYELMQDKFKFGAEISATVKRLPAVLNFSKPLNDFVIALLKVDPMQRPVARNACQLEWVVDKLVDCAHLLIPANPTVEALRGGQFRPHVVDSPMNTQSKSLMKSVMSNRERSGIKGDSKGGDMALPPIEPATPSIGKARKIMQKGDQLARKATHAADPPDAPLDEEELSPI
jgi:serine/threonine protein kinase